MNDRFKFRFYHYETETMYEVKAICFEGRPIVTVQYNPVLKFPLDSGELVQCTGLKDKNGKLIFEGDIVKVYSYKAVVVWGCHGWYLKLGDVLNSFSNYHNVLKTFEVIGNVHETGSY